MINNIPNLTTFYRNTVYSWVCSPTTQC